MKIFQKLQEIHTKFTSSTVSLEYDQAQQDHALNFFKIILIQISLGSIYLTTIDLIRGAYKGAIFLGVALACYPIFWIFAPKFKRFISYILAFVFIIFCLDGFLVIKNTIVSPEAYMVFFLGYAFGAYERIFTRQIPSFSAKMAFSLMNFLVRGLIFKGVCDTTVWVLQILMVLVGVIIDFFKDNYEKRRFQRFYDYRESLTKFKDMMSHGLPSRLLILSRDLKEEFFSNEPLQATMRKSILKKEGRIEMLHEWLDQLIIDKKTFSKTIKDSVQLDKESLSAEDFIQAFVAREHCLEDKRQRITFTAECYDPVGGMKNRYEIHFFAMIWDSKESVTLIINDVTERFVNISLKMANANKDKMLAMISHELRTPLNGILGVVNILEKQTKEPQTMQYLSLCKNNGELLLNLVNSILDLQQIRDDKFSLKITRYDLHELLRGVIQLFKFQFEQKSVELLLKMSGNVPQYIVSDQDRLRQILVNIIGNALKFTFEGQVTVMVELCLEGYLEFKISDTGLGIKEEDKHKLFKMYGRLGEENSKAVNTQGIGFGLEISNQLAKLLAEDLDAKGIKVQSEYGKGSTFSFLIQDFQQQVGQTHSLNNQNLSFDEPHVFAEEIENISIKMSPYATSLQLGSEREILPRSSFLSNMPSRFSSAQNIPSIHKRSSCSDRYLNQSPLSRLSKNNKLSRSPVGFASSLRTSLHLRWSNVGLLASGSQADGSHSENSICNPTAAELSSNPRSEKSEDSRRALIIDDNPFNLLVAKHLLEGLKFTVETALNGKLGVDLAKAAYVKQKKPFKLVLMDLQMPVMDGYEATKVLREMIASGEIPDLNIIAVSANDSEDDKKRSKEAGMDDHLSKPLNEKKLKEVLDNDDDDDNSSINSSFDKVD